MQLESKIVLVTGAGRGIGKAIAIGFAREGANVVAVSRTTGEIEETVNQVRSLGVKAMAIRADVSLAGDVQRVADAVAKDYGRLDVLVNNAALRMNQLGRKDSYTIPFTELSVEDWDSAIAVNLRGPFLCIMKFLPLMGESGGSIINVSAGGGKRGIAGRAPYCASKFGLEGLTQCLALEFRATNIAVNSLSPGRHSVLTDESKRDLITRDPGTIYMKPEMMVPPALFLAAQNGRGTTGQHIEALEWLVQNGQGGEQEWRVRL
jgi:3-oxoacyl-[acyl-carrier protein] reductase